MGVGLVGMADAGEILLTNGSRLEGELANVVLLVSTGSGLVEVLPEQVVSLTRDEVRLTDGRVVRGTLVGGQLKARTPFGELAIKLDELQAYSASRPPPGPAAASTAAPPAAGSPGAVGGSTAVATPPSQPAAPAAVATPGRRLLEVITRESALHRDAYAAAARVGRVVRGQILTYIDFIDRRLQILNGLINFDGGHWIKVRAADGTEGWVPADAVREVQ